MFCVNDCLEFLQMVVQWVNFYIQELLSENVLVVNFFLVVVQVRFIYSYSYNGEYGYFYGYDYYYECYYYYYQIFLDKDIVGVNMGFLCIIGCLEIKGLLNNYGNYYLDISNSN